MRIGWMICAVAVMLGVAWVVGQTTQPATQPTTRQMKISAEAQPLLSAMQDSYGKLKSLTLAGTLKLELDAAGQKELQQQQFTASYSAANRFRHEMREDVLVVSDGEKAFAYKPDENRYIALDPPKPRTPAAQLPAPLGPILAQQNPSLLLAISPDAIDVIGGDEVTIERQADAELDGVPHQVLGILSPGEQMRIVIDPRTNLVRQVSVDLKQQLVKEGIPDVKTAQVTIDYTQSQADAPVDAAAFQWTPPEDAVAIVSGQDDLQNVPAMALVGQPAPDFTLKDLKDASVTLSAQKGSVVVLDFWGTWCPPCHISMPHFNAIAKEFQAKQVKAYAINIFDTKPQAQQFAEAKRIDVTVLLDETGTVADKYRTAVFPTSIVIGKDGVVRDVLPGYGLESDAKLREAIDAALKS